MHIRRRHRRKLALGMFVAGVCVLMWMAIGRSQAPPSDIPLSDALLTVEDILSDIGIVTDQQPDSASASTEAGADKGAAADSTRIPSASVATDLGLPPAGSTAVDAARQPWAGDAAGNSDDAEREESPGSLAGSVQPSWGGGGHPNIGIGPSFGGGGSLGASASSADAAATADAAVDAPSDPGAESETFAWASPAELEQALTLPELSASPRALSAELFNQSGGSPPGSSHAPPSFSNAGGSPSSSNAGGPPSFSNAGGPPPFSNAGGIPSTGGAPGNSAPNSAIGGDLLIPPNEVTNLSLTDASVPVIPDVGGLFTSGPAQQPIANPEPASLLLLGSGLVLAARRLRRRRDRRII
jgi:hypothetical protein